MDFTEPQSFTIDVTQTDIDNSDSTNTGCALMVALHRVYSNLRPDNAFYFGVLTGTNVAAAAYGFVLNETYVTDNTTAVYIGMQTELNTKPLSPFTATLTLASNLNII